MPDFMFRNWLPDQGVLLTKGFPVLENAIPNVNGFDPILSLSDLGYVAAEGTPQLLYPAYDLNRTANSFLHTTTKIYRLTGATTGWVDVSRAGGYSGSDSVKWQQEIYNNIVYATNFYDPAQFWQLGGSTEWADVVPNAGEWPKAKYITSVDPGFIMVGYTNKVSEGVEINRLEWSGLGRPLEWGFNASVQSGGAYIPNIGELRGLTGGNRATLFCSHGIGRLIYEGPPRVFNLATFHDESGCLVDKTPVRVGGRDYYLSFDGWRAWDGQRGYPIGDNAVDDFFFGDADSSAYDNMYVVKDFLGLPIIVWGYTSINSVDGLPDKALIYNYKNNRWGNGLFPHQLIGISVSPGLSPDDPGFPYPTLDEMPGSLDDAIWKGGDEFAMAIANGGLSHTFSGAPYKTIMETPRINADRFRYLVSDLYPLVNVGDGVDISAQVETTDRPNESPIWQDIIEMTEWGNIPVDSESLNHRIRMIVEGGPWSQIAGFQYEQINTGKF